MIDKNKNVRVMVTLSKKTNDKLDFIVRNTNKKKSQIIEDLINQKTSMKRLWKEIDFEDLTEEDSIMYIMSSLESDYLPLPDNYTRSDFVNILNAYYNTKIVMKKDKVIDNFNWLGC